MTKKEIADLKKKLTELKEATREDTWIALTISLFDSLIEGLERDYERRAKRPKTKKKVGEKDNGDHAEGTEKDRAGMVKRQFLHCYEKSRKHRYPSWGAKENKMVQNWLRSVSLEDALILCQFYPFWNDPWVTKKGHPLEYLVKNTAEVFTWIKDSKTQALKIARARVQSKLQIGELEEREHTRSIAEQIRRDQLPSPSSVNALQEQADSGVQGPTRRVSESESFNRGSERNYQHDTNQV